MPEQHTIRVFFASPGDLEEERHVFGEVLSALSNRSRHRFLPLGFEDVLASTGPRPQDIINRLVDQCDVFLAVFHRRWGQCSPDAAVYTAYTEEEFERANRRFAHTGAPEIFCFFKHVDLSSLADPGEQLTKVLEFKRRLEASRQVLYRTFGTVTEFASELEKHLLAFANGELPMPRTSARRIHLPILADHAPETERTHDLAMMREAQLAAAGGQLEEASALFARLSQTSRNIEVLDIARGFFEQVGNTDAAQAVLERKVTLVHDRRLAAHEYAAVLMSHRWLDDLVAGMLRSVPAENHEAMERIIRELFTGSRFRELLIESMAEHFTVGELLSLSRFYRGEGGTVAGKLGHYIGVAVPEIISLLAGENPELFQA